MYDVALSIWVHRDIQLISEEPYGSSFHLSEEVVVVEPERPFPWSLLDLQEWTYWSEWGDLCEDLSRQEQAARAAHRRGDTHSL